MKIYLEVFILQNLGDRDFGICPPCQRIMDIKPGLTKPQNLQSPLPTPTRLRASWKDTRIRAGANREHSE